MSTLWQQNAKAHRLPTDPYVKNSLIRFLSNRNFTEIVSEILFSYNSYMSRQMTEKQRVLAAMEDLPNDATVEDAKVSLTKTPSGGFYVPEIIWSP